MVLIIAVLLLIASARLSIAALLVPSQVSLHLAIVAFALAVTLISARLVSRLRLHR